MSSQSRVVADGSAASDRHETVRVDRTDDAERWRYCCPEGHADWAETNSHIWCATCQSLNEHGEDYDPEHYEILDKRSGESIPWSAVELVEPDRPRRA